MCGGGEGAAPASAISDAAKATLALTGLCRAEGSTTEVMASPLSIQQLAGEEFEEVAPWLDRPPVLVEEASWLPPHLL